GIGGNDVTEYLSLRCVERLLQGFSFTRTKNDAGGLLIVKLFVSVGHGGGRKFLVTLRVIAYSDQRFCLGRHRSHGVADHYCEVHHLDALKVNAKLSDSDRN